jgi:hypothetical protein
VLQRWDLYQNARPCKLHPPKANFRIKFPRNFRQLRALAIASWYLPDWLKYEVILHLSTDFIYSLDIKAKGFQLSLELGCLSYSEEVMLSWIEEGRLSTRVLFGTVLQEDLVDALRSLEIFEEQQGPVVRPIRRKGYKDKGTWKSPDRWTEHFDFSFNQEQFDLEKKRFSFTLLLTYTRHMLSQKREIV